MVVYSGNDKDLINSLIRNENNKHIVSTLDEYIKIENTDENYICKIKKVV